MDWEVEKADWPNSDISQFVETPEAKWHFQKTGAGSKVLLLHGSGATTHSFEGLMQELRGHHEVLAIDLPGHGFSSELRRVESSLSNVAVAIGQLLNELDFAPELIVGHSAGAAIAVELVHRSIINPKGFVAINGAFYPFPGFAGSLFPAMAKLLFLNPLVPSIFAISASRARVARLMDSTGSKLTQKQIHYYERALASSKHVRGTLAMMASWQLETMQRKLQALNVPTCLLIGGADGTIDPNASVETEKSMPNCSRQLLNGFGHLVHEEAPELVSECIRDFWSQNQGLHS